MSIGIILQIMPSLPISQVILHIIGIMPMPIIGIIMGIPIIMGFIIMGFIPIIGFIPIMGFIPIIGFMPIMFGIMGIGIIWLFIGIGIAFIMMTASYLVAAPAQGLDRHSCFFPLLVRRTVSLIRNLSALADYALRS